MAFVAAHSPGARRDGPIDVFFRSLAQDLGPRAVAIVLSGGGSDGSRGIRDVAEAGGLVIAGRLIQPLARERRTVVSGPSSPNWASERAS
jgi:hypothetical protein